ncbi:hypothetical protein ACFPZP_14185 [Citrobacter bitternis]|uniref:Uncharacterized protein n=1 Tax=Citrobacter bitternis TaxID=1585982 RepID=A0ABW1Q1Y6_9ENTR
MNRTDYMFALSEREQLDHLLKGIPEGPSITRKSLEARLKNVEKVISEAQLRKHEPTHAILTFKGPTVIGTHGISASFGPKAVAFFNDAISYVASAFNGPLPSSGKVPDSQNNHLMITSAARGSFGFVLEEFRPDAPLDFDEQSSVSKALEKTQKILQSSLDNNDEELSEAIIDLDVRALEKLRNFINFLFENKTVFTLKNDGINVSFRDPNQLERTYLKLSSDNIKQDTVTESIIFLGTLPNKRQCEFVILGDTDIKTAKIDKSFEDPSLINKHLGTPATATFIKKTVGDGRPRYILINSPTWDI